MAECLQMGCVLEDYPMEKYKAHSDLFEEDLYDEINLENCMMKRTSLGGTNPKSVNMQIDMIKAYLAEKNYD